MNKNNTILAAYIMFLAFIGGLALSLIIVLKWCAKFETQLEFMSQVWIALAVFLLIGFWPIWTYIKAERKTSRLDN